MLSRNLVAEEQERKKDSGAETISEFHVSVGGGFGRGYGSEVGETINRFLSFEGRR